MAVGLGCFLYQWANGLGVTGLSNTVSWGLYIVSFMFLVGISAGGLIVVAGSELVETERFATLTRLAVVLSGAAIATAAVSILPDLGRPQMVWRMLVTPNPTSPLVWDVMVITLYLAVAVVDLWILTGPPERRPSRMRTTAFVALPAAVLVHSVTAWIFGLLVARPFWNTALIAPMFISSAMVSGTALLILVALVVERVTRWKPAEGTVADLGKLMLWFLALDAFLLFSEILTTYASNVPDHIEQLDVLLFGRLAPIFWTEVVLGVLAPFVLFSRRSWRVHPALLAAGAAFALVGVLFKRVNILMASLFEPLVGLAPGIPGGRPGQPFRPDEIYVPTWVEAGVLIGLTALFLTLVTFGVRYVVLRERADR
jgi:molybdopterin-containing oxidoreductase family membrane subunit